MAITERRLTAILAADVCDFSKMMGENEDRTIQNLRTCRELIEGSITSHNGNIFNTAGDSIVAEFGSVVDAVNCAVSFQETLRDRNDSVPEESKMEFRVGINLGDIIIEGDNRYGDGINIAARLEGLSEPGGICISGSVYSDIKSKLNLEFGAMGEQVLKNIAQPVSAYKIDFRGDDPVPMASIGDLDNTPITQPEQSPITVSKVSKTPKQTQSEKPSIAVLPFDNMSNDPEQEYFADGITEEIIAELSRIKGLRVIARNSTFDYKGKVVNIEKASKELGVNHILEGSVRRSGDKLRIIAQLIYTPENSHRWAEKYNGSIDDVFELQDEISRNIAESLDLEFSADSQVVNIQRDHESKLANDFCLRGRHAIVPPTLENLIAANSLFEQALKIDRYCAQAFAGMGRVAILRAWQIELDEKRRKDLTYESEEFIDKALEINPELIDAYYARCIVYSLTNRQEEALNIAKKLVAEYPGDYQSNLLMSTMSLFHGSYLEAEAALKEAISLDPLYGVNNFILIQIRHALEDYSGTLKIFDQYFDDFQIKQLPKNIWGYKLSTLVLENKIEEGEAFLNDIQLFDPTFTIERADSINLLSDKRQKIIYIDSLKKAGLT